MNNSMAYNQARPRALIGSRMKMVFDRMELHHQEFDCFLVGVKIPENGEPGDVCVEAANNKWDTGVFDRLPQAIKSSLARDSRYTQKGNNPTERDRTKREAAKRAVESVLDVYDAEHAVRSFSGWPGQLGEHCVVPVLQFPETLFQRFRPLRDLPAEDTFPVPQSFVHAAIKEVLNWAHEEIREESPGGGLFGNGTPPQEMIHKAATNFLHAPGRAIGDDRVAYPSLFECLNSISMRMYEGSKSTGRLLLAQTNSKRVHMELKLATPVPLREPIWARKALEMTSPGLHLVADTQNVWGLGRLAEGVDLWKTQDVFAVDFVDHYYWRLVCGDEVLLVCRYAVPTLPNRYPSYEVAKARYSQQFPAASTDLIERFLDLYKAAVDQDHGSMLVVAHDVKTEAKRLERQCTRIEPVLMTSDLFRHVSQIDGSILVDPDGLCYAVGVILDGKARQDCHAARGARYNSAVRYVRGVRARGWPSSFRTMGT